MKSRWFADLVLGVRLAVGGGRTSWARLALTAAGVGLGVVVLLLAASIGPAREAKSERVQAASLVLIEEAGPLRAREVVVSWQGRRIVGVELAATGSERPAPPGAGRLPGPGEVVVSPELLHLIETDASARARFPERVIGVIADAGLPRPKSLLFYAGLSDVHAEGARPASGFGADRPRSTLPPVYRLLMVAGITALLVPLGIFVLVATRLGATGRDRRLAAIRLVGASRAQVRWIAGGETLTGAVLGLFVGVALFFAARPLARFIEVEGVGFFPTDLLPDPLLGVLIAVGVPVVAVVSALVALRAVDVGPLGLARAFVPPVRRTWWRFALIGAGVAVLVVISVVGSSREVVVDAPLALALGAGIGLVLAGTGAVLPWLVARVADRVHPERVAPMLAVRGLRSDSGMPRVLSGVVVVLTGSLALQVLLGVGAQVAAESALNARSEPDRWVLEVTPHTPVRSLEEAIGLVGGVRRVSEVRTHAEQGAVPLVVVSTDCPELVARLGVDDCVPGAAYRSADGPGVPPAGTQVAIGGRPWTVPRHRTVPGRESGLFVAGGIDPVLDAIPPSELVVVGAPDQAFGDGLLAAAGRVDRGVVLRSTFRAGQVELFTSLRGGVIGGSALLVLLAVVGLAAAAVDQVWERRRHTAVLVANGVPREVLTAATLWQSAIPAALGIALAVPIGLGTAWLVVPAERFRVDWTELVTTVASAAVVVLVVSLCTLPALRQAIRPESLRTE
ncbi:FtsX-like permease family protein [Saccharothrix australiensis]|uniref:FtsX-like permease family protein n=1 Tax=Saccharothrix australiensis TaxID=2072 RepID=A0A495WA14_9PSEU|nr:FtsX-like permease family protein [Saccharothrix australiensis]RKT57960.1 FtsX-like permease family protein [Saccharothrix australiensis]